MKKSELKKMIKECIREELAEAKYPSVPMFKKDGKKFVANPDSDLGWEVFDVTKGEPIQKAKKVASFGRMMHAKDVIRQMEKKGYTLTNG